MGMLRSPASSEGLASPPEQGGVYQHSLIDASTPSPCLGGGACEVCEGRVEGRSPPRLVLGAEAPSEEALAVECNTLVQILHEGDNDDDTPPSGAMGGGASWQPDDGVDEPSTPSTTTHTLDEKEDWCFEFLNNPDSEGDFDDDEHDMPDITWDASDDEDDAAHGDGQSGAPFGEFVQATVDGPREAMALAGRVGYPVMIKTSDAGSKGVRIVHCAGQMESMYQEVTDVVPGAAVILMRLSSILRPDKPSVPGNPKMTEVSSPLPSLQSPFLSSQTSDLARVESPLTTHVSGPATRPLQAGIPLFPGTSGGGADPFAGSGWEDHHTRAGTPALFAAGAGTSSGRKKGTSQHWEHEHAKQADLCYPDFVCNCNHAKSRGRSSCLKQFNPEQLMDFHRESFGVYIGRDPTNADVGPSALGVRIHRLMWPLREPLKPDGTEDEDGKSWKIGTWKLGDKAVCRKAWERAYGAAHARYRTIYSLVQRGHAPHHDDASQQAKSILKLMDRVTDAAGVCLTEKRSWAANWWKEVLLLMDWMPSEQRIRIRGPGFLFLHANTYGPRAKAVGMYLSYKAWKGCMKQGVHDVCLELPGSIPAKVRVGRACNHANFPECTKCHTKRNRWLSAAKSSRSDPATVKVG